MIQSLLLVLSVVLMGCSSFGKSRTVYVPAGSIVRLRETLHDVDVWAKDKNKQWVEGKLDLPEGWYALADPGPDTD